MTSRDDQTHREVDPVREPDPLREPEPRGEGDRLDDPRVHHAAPPETDESLLPSDHAEQFRTRWESIQGRFVDEPRVAVAEADDLVQEVMDRLRATFDYQRRGLESEWGTDGDSSSTEDLRVAFQRYRAFFQRLLRA